MIHDTQSIPLVDLKKQYNSIKTEIDEAIQRVLDSQQFILGPEVSEFEKEISTYCNVKYAIGVSSGSDALLVALMALDIKPGDEVITSSYSFFATAGAIARLGAKPVFVDIEADTYNIDPNKIEELITSRTKAIIPVHLYGQMANMDEISKIANENSIDLIEDAAQSIGADINGLTAGSFGKMGCFSFFPTKNLGAYGDGGLVTTNNDQVAKKLLTLRNHGFSKKYHSEILGGNFRLDSIQAAILRVKLRHLNKWIASRQVNASKYKKFFSNQNNSPKKQNNPKIRMPVETPGYKHVYNQFVVRVTNRDELYKYLKNNNIGSEIYYPIPLNQQPCFNANGQANKSLPQSELAAKETIALPIYPEMTESMIEKVVTTISEFYS
tara:strand:- start:197 stop:1342 length:1146 start_codon:yes stop_codon:yes gene_type:complete